MKNINDSRITREELIIKRVSSEAHSGFQVQDTMVELIKGVLSETDAAFSWLAH